MGAINWGDEEVREFKRWEGKRGKWKGEVINWGDEEVREFKRWEGERGRGRGEVKEQLWERFFFLNKSVREN